MQRSYVLAASADIFTEKFIFAHLKRWEQILVGLVTKGVHFYNQSMQKFLFCLMAALSIAAVACTKSTDLVAPAVPPRKDEFPVSAYLRDSASYLKLTVFDPQAKEVGYSFQALKNGVVWALGIRMPQAGEKFTITCWDGSTKKIINQKQVENVGTGFTYADLSSNGYKESFAIEKNKTYVITVNTTTLSPASPNRSFYLLSKANAGNFLPLVLGNIKILNGVYSSQPAPTPVFPDKTNMDVFGLDLLFGLTDIGYYATEY
ncbi:MAG: DUF4082 domain-containing protein [Bacteroidota bacterium]|nr:DUF4082 domain-containing protein [Bacteroidota bacterium]